MKKVLLILCISCGLVGLPQENRAGSITGGATEVTQILNNVQLLLQVAEQIETYKKLVEQYADMLQNTDSLEAYFFDTGIDSILELLNAYQTDEILVYTSETLEEDYSIKYPGYEEYLEVGSEGWTSQKISEVHSALSIQQEENAKKALLTARQAGIQFNDENTLIDALKIQASSASGRKQALDVANEIALAGLNFNQKLRQLVLTQIQLQANHQAHEVQLREAKQARADAAQKSLEENMDKVIRDDGKNW